MNESVERQSGVNELELEIEVTPQMLEAGKYALFPSEVLPWYDEEQVLAKIYRAMAMASPVANLPRKLAPMEIDEALLWKSLRDRIIAPAPKIILD